MRKEPTVVGRDLDRLFRLGTAGSMTDPQLLEEFVGGDHESASLAFEALVERHGPMVLRVCRMVLRDPHAAEDAFQATFLVLARKAQNIGSRELLCNWLYGVADRTARKAKALAARRRAHDREVAFHRSVAVVDTPSDGFDDDVQQILHEEIGRLPRAYRSAVVVCYLQGKSQSQAAAQLRLAESTIRGRLARARKLLGRRLALRGVAPASVLLALGTTANACAGMMPRATARAAVRAALHFVNRTRAAPGAISVMTQGLANGEFSTMSLYRVKTLAAVLLALGTVATAVALLTQPVAQAQLQKTPAQDEASPEIAIASLEPLATTDPSQPKPKRRRDQQDKQKREEPVVVDPDLVRLAPGPILRAVHVSKDSMILSYMPQWDHGEVDNIGFGNADGGNRTMIEWPAVPPDEAAAPDHQFLIAVYSRETNSNPPAGPIHAFEITEDWRERSSWKTQPKYDPEPVGTYKLVPGKGWKLFDITPLVRAQAKAGRKGHGVLLRFLSEDSSGLKESLSDYKCVSREGTGEWENFRPLFLIVKAQKH